MASIEPRRSIWHFLGKVWAQKTSGHGDLAGHLRMGKEGQYGGLSADTSNEQPTCILLCLPHSFIVIYTESILNKTRLNS